MTERLFLGLLTPSEILAILTLVLVALTAWYSWLTRSTVNEMKRARASAVLPRISFKIHTLAAGVGWLRLVNVGPGPALDLDATMTLQPNGWDIRWVAHVVAPGEFHDFIATPPDDPSGQLGYLDRLVERFSHVRLVATYKDALGEVHRTEETFEIREWWRSLVDAHSLVLRDHAEDAVKELAKLNKSVEKLASEAAALRARDDPKPWKWEMRLGRLPAWMQPPARRVLTQLGLLRPY